MNNPTYGVLAPANWILVDWFAYAFALIVAAGLGREVIREIRLQFDPQLREPVRTFLYHLAPLFVFIGIVCVGTYSYRNLQIYRWEGAELHAQQRKHWAEADAAVQRVRNAADKLETLRLTEAARARVEQETERLVNELTEQISKDLRQELLGGLLERLTPLPKKSADPVEHEETTPTTAPVEKLFLHQKAIRRQILRDAAGLSESRRVYKPLGTYGKQYGIHLQSGQPTYINSTPRHTYVELRGGEIVPMQTPSDSSTGLW